MAFLGALSVSISIDTNSRFTPRSSSLATNAEREGSGFPESGDSVGFGNQTSSTVDVPSPEIPSVMVAIPWPDAIDISAY